MILSTKSHTFIKRLLPTILVVGFFGCFLYDAFHYIINGDDVFNDETVSTNGIVKSIAIFYEGINGRWFSHIITAVCFAYLKHNYFYYAAYVTFIMILFVMAVSMLHKNYIKTFLQKETSSQESEIFAFVFTATLYFLLIAERQEIWAWVSSVNNHLLSVVLGIMLLALLLKENAKWLTSLIVFLVSAFIGGLNEVNAVCSALTVAGFFVLHKCYFSQIKLSNKNMFLAVAVIGVSLATNVLSGGYTSRMNSLPNFMLVQSLKNTIHTFALPVMQYKLIPLRLGVVLIFLFFVNGAFYKQSISKKGIWITLGILCIVSISFFFHCYILSDIVPPRGEAWGYTLMLFMTFAFAGKKNEGHT